MSIFSMTMDGTPSGAATAQPQGGLLARLIAAREARVERQTLAYLAAQSDERLHGLGFDAQAIRALRQDRLLLPTAR